LSVSNLQKQKTGAYSRKCQTATATPAKPGVLLFGIDCPMPGKLIERRGEAASIDHHARLTQSLQQSASQHTVQSML
jgi:hypothetical protein